MHLDKLIWPKHSLGEEVIGNGETVSRINRNDLTEFLNNYYRASNMVIACSGNIDREQLLTLLAEKIKKDVSLIKLNANAPRGLTGQAVITENKQLEQAHLCLGFRGIKYADPQRVAAELLNVVLGANMSSRLFEEIREKKALCYDVSTELRKFRDSGALVIHLGLDSQKIDLALKTIFGELKKIKEKNISSGELSRAKDYLLGQTTMALERPQGRMFCFAETLITLNRVLTLEEMKQEINAVTGEEIKKIAGDIFDFSKACVSCIGELPLDKEKTIRRIING
jgi:predicted Zn-dependent peptidase